MQYAVRVIRIVEHPEYRWENYMVTLFVLFSKGSSLNIETLLEGIRVHGHSLHIEHFGECEVVVARVC